MPTASVWPVTGTGDGGIGIEIWASSAVSAAPAKTRTASRARTPGSTSARTSGRAAVAAAGEFVTEALLGVALDAGKVSGAASRAPPGVRTPRPTGQGQGMANGHGIARPAPGMVTAVALLSALAAAVPVGA